MKQKVALLVKYGTNPKCKNKFGNTAVDFYKKKIQENEKEIKEYTNSQKNKVRITQTKNKNIQSIVDNAFGGKQYIYKDVIYKEYNKNLEEALEVLNEN